ncbi:Uncharacterised protein [Grimontia hollisae]|nr:Uncharacterised protein [Grimontia hollisae]
MESSRCESEWVCFRQQEKGACDVKSYEALFTA